MQKDNSHKNKTSKENDADAKSDNTMPLGNGGNEREDVETDDDSNVAGEENGCSCNSLLIILMISCVLFIILYLKTRNIVETNSSLAFLSLPFYLGALFFGAIALIYYKLSSDKKISANLALVATWSCTVASSLMVPIVVEWNIHYFKYEHHVDGLFSLIPYVTYPFFSLLLTFLPAYSWQSAFFEKPNADETSSGKVLWAFISNILAIGVVCYILFLS